MHRHAGRLVRTMALIGCLSGCDRLGPPAAAAAAVGQPPVGSKLHVAAATGDTAQLAELLAAGAVLESRNDQGRTPLYEAAKRGQTAVVALLLDRGADPNAPSANESGFTPVHVAGEFGHVETLRLLLDRGGDVSVRSRMGFTPLAQVCSLSTKRALESAELLLDRGADIEAASIHGYTPLLHAAGRDPALVDLLLRRGADGLRGTDQGWRAAHLAAHVGNVGTIAALAKHRVPLDAPTTNGWTALAVAINDGQREAVGALLEAGAGPGTGIPGWDALKFAEAKHEGAIAELLRGHLGIPTS